MITMLVRQSWPFWRHRQLASIERVSNGTLAMRTKTYIAQTSLRQHQPPRLYLQYTCISSKRHSTIRSFSAKDNNNNVGEQLYQQYLETRDKLQQMVQQREEQKSQEMFKAWQRAEEKAQNPKTTGVTVVKTLVKQTRKQEQQESSSLEQEAQELLERAANGFQHPQALVQLGNQTLQEIQSLSSNNNNKKKKELLDRVMDLYRQAGECGAAEGWYNLGNLLWTGYNNNNNGNEVLLSANHEAALEIFDKAVNLGDADAMYFVGVQQLLSADDNNNVDQKRLETSRAGLELIERAAGLGHGGALYYLALFYLNGHQALKISPCSPQEFVERLDKAVEAESSDALFVRGHSYYHGEHGCPQDYRRALGDFLKAADKGHADAAVSAGAILHQGHKGIHRDQEKAFELYQYAGELGSIEGWRNVVACYATGEGVPQSKEIAKYIAQTMLKDDKK